MIIIQVVLLVSLMMAAGNVNGDDGWLDISFTTTAKPSVQDTTANATTTLSLSQVILYRFSLVYMDLSFV